MPASAWNCGEGFAPLRKRHPSPFLGQRGDGLRYQQRQVGIFDSRHPPWGVKETAQLLAEGLDHTFPAKEDEKVVRILLPNRRKPPDQSLVRQFLCQTN